MGRRKNKRNKKTGLTKQESMVAFVWENKDLLSPDDRTRTILAVNALYQHKHISAITWKFLFSLPRKIRQAKRAQEVEQTDRDILADVPTNF